MQLLTYRGVMLHELLFALLGFVGDIIVEKDNTYCVKDGFDFLREGERDQVNRLAPLGWYYVNLGQKVAQNDLGWASSVKSKAYMISMVQGVADLLQEYVGDISYLEQLVLADGPVPLSQVLQHLQKVNVLFRISGDVFLTVLFTRGPFTVPARVPPTVLHARRYSEEPDPRLSDPGLFLHLQYWCACATRSH